MTKRTSARSAVEPFRVMDIVGAAQQRQRTHGDAIMLCVGQPEATTPDEVLAAAMAADHGYTPILGLDSLRERVARWHRDTYRVNTTADNVVITTGSSGGLVALFLTLLDAGEHIAITDPGYPAYRNTASAVNLAVDTVPVDESTRYQPTVELFEKYAPDARAVIVTSPANPTGTIIDEDELARIATWAKETGRWLISDEIYHGISFGRPTATARAYNSDAIVVGSMSKYFTMTGWRVGWLIVPEDLTEPLSNLLGNLTLCPPAVSQYAALAAFDNTTSYDELVARYTTNVRLAADALDEMGLKVAAPPDGSFYLYVDISSTGLDSEEFCARLLADTGVAIAPGVDFGSNTRVVRISICGDTTTLNDALTRIKNWIPNL